ncbi:MAG: hypothetical protein ETSY1_45125 [Candidatus Entotheonella factor]|uniref:Uncharacterized protein n=1 Tax=Entotheonella factor TaxID=1429438 RepID=W4L356_ENTF1|nr:MAG: hypothetical protein ETSY1_45125 [Candidatus Entotheonella factor]
MDFETKILAKMDAPELLRKELASPRWKPETTVVWLLGDGSEDYNVGLQVFCGIDAEIPSMLTAPKLVRMFAKQTPAV